MKRLLTVNVINSVFSVEYIKEYEDVKYYQFIGKIFLDIGNKNINKHFTKEIIERSELILSRFIREECLKLFTDEFKVAEVLSFVNNNDDYDYEPVSIIPRHLKKEGNFLSVNFSLGDHQVASFINGTLDLQLQI